MTSKTFAISRAVGVIGATAVLATGVTFAALQSNVATLSDNSVAATTASLSLYDAVSGTFKTPAAGFTVTDLTPGTLSSPKPFYLKNDGTSALDLAVKAESPASAVGFDQWSELKVQIKDFQGTLINTDMAALIAGNVALPGDELPAGAQGDGNSTVAGNYTISFYIDAADVSGSTLSVGNFDLDFIGSVD